jgi:hypothetical protein
MNAVAQSFACTLVGAMLLTACGSPATTPSPPSAGRHPVTTPTPDLKQASRDLERIANEYVDGLQHRVSLFQTAYKAQDGTGVHGQALAILQATTALDDGVAKLSLPAAAESDRAALRSADAALEAVMESLLEASSWDDVVSAYQQLPGKETALQQALQKLESNVGAAPLTVLPPIAGR